MATIPITLETVSSVTSTPKSPSQLFYFLQQLNQKVARLEIQNAELQSRVAELETRNDPSTIVRMAQRELASGGHFPLFVGALRGQLADVQPSRLIAFPADPTVAGNNINANLYLVGEAGWFGAHIYVCVAGNPHTWTLIV